MDDLLMFINILFCGNAGASPPVLPDSVLLSLFQAAGAPSVSCVDPGERQLASYPRFVLSGDEGEQEQTGDGQNKFVNGVVKLEIVTRQTDGDADALDTLAGLKARVTDLLLGNYAAGLLPMQGRKVSAGVNVPVFYQTKPTGRLPVDDPTFKRWGATYSVKINRLTA